MRLLIVLLFGALSLTSCSGGDGIAFEFYVVLAPEKTSEFIGVVSAIAKEDGLETAVGQARSDTGSVLTVLEGRGHGVKLWVQNVPLSGEEDKELCGYEPHPDPGQFMVSTEPRFFGSQATARELGKRVLLQIRKSGFDVRQKPVVCGAAVNRNR